MITKELLSTAKELLISPRDDPTGKISSFGKSQFLMGEHIRTMELLTLRDFKHLASFVRGHVVPKTMDYVLSEMRSSEVLPGLVADQALGPKDKVPFPTEGKPVLYNLRHLYGTKAADFPTLLDGIFIPHGITMRGK